MQQDFYIIQSDGSLCHAPLRRVTNAADILRGLARSEPIVYNDYPQRGYKFKASPESVVLAKKLDRIKLNTWFAPITLPDGTSRITPVWYDNTLALQQVMEFRPPDGHEFWFLCPFDMQHQLLSDFPHLCWKIVGDNIYRPPFSNTYDDGRICMGRAWSRPESGSLVEQFEIALDWFQSTSSNTDLRPGSPPVPLLLWDPVTMEPDYRAWENLDTSHQRSMSGWIYDKIIS